MSSFSTAEDALSHAALSESLPSLVGSPLLRRSAIVKSSGIELLGLADYFKSNHFDYLIILGDRYETLMVAYAATIFNIPIVHLCGGDITLGSLDNKFRHSITCMAKYHFVTNDQSREKVLELGFTEVFGSSMIRSHLKCSAISFRRLRYS